MCFSVCGAYFLALASITIPTREARNVVLSPALPLIYCYYYYGFRLLLFLIVNARVYSLFSEPIFMFLQYNNYSVIADTRIVETFVVRRSRLKNWFGGDQRRQQSMMRV